MAQPNAVRSAMALRWSVRALRLALVLCGCSDRVDVVATPATLADAGRDGAVDAATDAAPGDAAADASPLDAELPDACTDPSSAAITRAAAHTVAEVASSTVTHALCTCDDYSGSARLTVRGSLGVDGAMSQNGDTDVSSGVTIADVVGLSLGGGTLLTAGADLAVGGPVLGGEARVGVAGDMRVAGRVQLQELTVGGTLRQPATAALEVAAGSDSITFVADTVSVDPSCPCGDDNRLDPAALGALHAAVSDGGVLGGDCTAARLRRDDASPLMLEVSASGSLLIDGDLAVDGDASIDVAAGATLDLFVMGNMRVDGVLDLGGAGAVRLFVTGDGTIELKGGGLLRGLLHAPDAELVVPAPLSIDGSALVRRVAAAAELDVGRR